MDRFNLNKIKREGMYIILSIVLTFFVIGIANIFSGKVHLEVGQISSENYFAPFQIENEIATEKKKQLAEQSIANVTVINPVVLEGAITNINQLFSSLEEVKNLGDERLHELAYSLGLFYKDEAIGELSSDEKEAILLKQLKYTSSITLTDDITKLLLRMSEKDLAKIKEVVLNYTQDILEEGVALDDSPSSKIRTKINDSNLETIEKEMAYEIILSQIKPNIVVDEATTEAERKKVREQVEPVYVLKGERIVAEGSRITEESYALLKKAGIIETGIVVDKLQYIGVLLLVCLLGILFIYFLNSKDSSWNMKEKESRFVFIVFVFSLLAILIFKSSNPIFIPLSLGSVLIAILIKKELAVLMHVIFVVIGSLIYKESQGFFAYTILTGLMSIFIVGDMKHRKETIVNSIIIGIVHALVFISVSLSLGMPFETKTGLQAVQAFLMGLVQVLVAIGSLSLWEMLFGFVTPMQLLELTNPSQPLLKKLLIEATGTYHHSLLIANLAETAADEIGANPLLTRVGGYYHDIGKLKSSRHFKENQVNENLHENLDAYQSAQIIRSHVDYGVQLGKENNLPQCVIDIIQQHHGTTAIQYFYVTAKEKDSSVKLEDFQYRGPKPQSKEAALVMLADVVEATVRAMQSKIGKEVTIEEVVRKMVKQKLADGQLDECSIYVSDIEKIVQAFTKLLKGMYHERIEYPESKTSN